MQRRDFITGVLGVGVISGAVDFTEAGDERARERWEQMSDDQRMRLWLRAGPRMCDMHLMPRTSAETAANKLEYQDGCQRVYDYLSADYPQTAKAT